MKRLILAFLVAFCIEAYSQEAPQPMPEPPELPMIAMAEIQGPPPAPADAPPAAMPGPGGRHERGFRGPAAWWRDSNLAKELKLTDQQQKQLETTFSDYRLKLIDLRAAVEREQAKLEPLVNADQLNEPAINSQLDSLLAARNKLEKTNAQMALDMRKVLTLDQWKQLRQMRPMHPGFFGGGPRGDRDGDRPGRPRGPRPPMDPQSPSAPQPKE